MTLNITGVAAEAAFTGVVKTTLGNCYGSDGIADYAP